MKKNKEIYQIILENDLEALKIKIKKEVDILGEYDSTPLHYACRIGSLEIVELLIKRGANVNSRNSYSTIYPIFDAITSSKKETHLPVIQLLTENGANINRVDAFGNTLLHYAVEEENITLIKLLIELGCDVNYSSRDDQDSVLHYACFKENRKIISILIEKGANREFLNIYNKTPESYLLSS